MRFCGGCVLHFSILRMTILYYIDLIHCTSPALVTLTHCGMCPNNKVCLHSHNALLFMLSYVHSNPDVLMSQFLLCLDFL